MPTVLDRPTEVQTEALSRAVSGQTLSNYPTIFRELMARGIPEADIMPRENVFTFQAWRALGRTVRRGEHGVKVITYRTITKKTTKPDGTEGEETFSRPWSATVFHISQTDVWTGNGKRGASC